MRDQKTIYGTVEFGHWSSYAGLIPPEQKLVETYLDPAASTLEAGTGGGRILLALQERGFTGKLAGFDFVPKLIEAAKGRDTGGTIDFRVQDARALDYGDESFAQIVYVQQVLCFIDSEEGRLQAAREAYRVLQPGGIALFSFLSYETRRRSPTYAALMLYLRALRAVTFRRRSRQLLPWLRLASKFNAACLLDRGPYNYWYYAEEAGRMLEQAGFQIRAAGWGDELADGTLHGSCAELARTTPAGMIMVVCTKP